MDEIDAIPLRPAKEEPVPDDLDLRRALCDHLAQFVSPDRLQRIEQVLAQRTRWVTVALEEVYQTHNASAILRSCDCFGVQDVHIVDERNQYTIHNTIALGSAQWLDLYRHEGPNSEAAIRRCCDGLRGRGYRLLATTPDPGATELDEVDVAAGPIALLFGTELEGLTSQAMEQVDEAIRIPMVGFTQSLNVSVSTALILRQLTTSLRARSDVDGSLSEVEQTQIRLRWLRRSMHHGEALIRRFLGERSTLGSALPDENSHGQRIVPDLHNHDDTNDDATDDEVSGEIGTDEHED
ncbi:MAG: RNA methyltransferase [Candidatus Latescibacterota bacterium]|nr:RNA methyltransferase [Candidatus Latescibacterota bacterium]